MSYLDKVIEGYIQKPKITMTRLNEQGGELPSNIRPETPADLIALSIRDLGMIQQDMRSHLAAMQKSRAAERLILQVEQEIDLLDGIIERLRRASEMTAIGQHNEAYGPEVMNKDEWLPASGGTETPFTARSGTRLLYCWNPKLKKHAYLNLDTDTILTDEEARTHLQTY